MAMTMLLAAGACFFTASGSFDKCALQPTECSSDQVFRSPAWLTENNNDVSSQCSTQESLQKMKSLGRCDSISDRYICTSDPTACRISATFEPLTQDCNLVNDFLSSNEFSDAHFGFCEGQSDFCAWRFQECGDSYNWNIADPYFAAQNPDCHCDDVRTGACVDSTENNMFCAVTPEVCDETEGYIYRPALDLESTLNITCKLCDVLLNVAAPSESDASISDGSISDDTKAEAKKGSTVSGGAIAGIAIGSLLGIVTIATGVAFAIKHNLSSKEMPEHIDDDPSIHAPSVA